jgi:hypothetical protein
MYSNINIATHNTIKMEKIGVHKVTANNRKARDCIREHPYRPGVDELLAP